MKVEVSKHVQQLSSGTNQHMLGLLVELTGEDTGEALVDAVRQAFLDWKAEFDKEALILKATVKGADQKSKELFGTLLEQWNADADIQGASNTMVDIDYYQGEKLRLMRITNGGQAAQGNTLRLQIFQSI